MEQRIEKNIDKFLETIAPMLYLANIIIGIIMILAGIILLVKKTNHKKQRLYGSICIVIGIIATVSGFLQG